MQLTSLIYYLFLTIGSTVCYPSKPLNERSTSELAWQAWLLVDQARSGLAAGGELMRKRITPKSVFIAPTFTPDSMPACADGYQSDVMGRCIRIFKIDEASHLKFLMEQIRHKFPKDEADYEDYDDEGGRVEVTQEPLQLKIPFSFETKVTQSSDYDADFTAILVTRNSEKTPANVDLKRNGNDKFNVANVAAILGVKPEEVEMTTFEAFTSTTQTMTEEGTTIELTTQSTTIPTTTTIETTTTSTTTETDSTSTINITTGEVPESSTTVLPTSTTFESTDSTSDHSAITTETLQTTTTNNIVIETF